MSEVGREAACLCDLSAGLCLFDNRACVWLLSSRWAEYHCTRKGVDDCIAKYTKALNLLALRYWGDALEIGGSVGNLKPTISQDGKKVWVPGWTEVERALAVLILLGSKDRDDS